ncbi:MAG: hypothetical protein RL404_546 [Pseudomonadota bacterium]|jgi:general secretion pathway protein C
MNAAINAGATTARQRLPAVIAFLLFIVLCASIAYWALQWLAPPPRPIAAPVAVERALPPLSAAANLFGGAAKTGSLANVQLRGIIHAGRAAGSAAIITVEGSPPRIYRLNTELMPGVSVKAIHARSVVLSDRGAERELPLPAFAAQEGSAGGTTLRTMPEQGLPSQPSPQVQPVQPQVPSQGQPQSQLQAQQMMPQAAGPSSLGSSAAGAEPAQEQSRRTGRNLRRPRYQSD